MFQLYHGTHNPELVVDAIIGAGLLRQGFHLTPDIEVARNYGKVVVVTLEKDLTKAHVGTINKDGNYNANVGNGTEIVLKTPAAVNEFYANLYDAQVLQ